MWNEQLQESLFWPFFSGGRSCCRERLSLPPSPLAHKYRRDNRYGRAIHAHTHTYTEVVARPGIHRTTATLPHVQSSTFTSHTAAFGEGRAVTKPTTHELRSRVCVKNLAKDSPTFCATGCHDSLQVKMELD